LPVLLEFPAAEDYGFAHSQPALATRLFDYRGLTDVMQLAVVAFDQQITPVGRIVLATGADHAAGHLFARFQFRDVKRRLPVMNLIEVARPGFDDVDRKLVLAQCLLQFGRDLPRKLIESTRKSHAFKEAQPRDVLSLPLARAFVPVGRVIERYDVPRVSSSDQRAIYFRELIAGDGLCSRFQNVALYSRIPDLM
jgi:hypothetical protein